LTGLFTKVGGGLFFNIVLKVYILAKSEVV